MSYSTLARYYDVIHAELTEDVEFVLELARDCGGAILELGCGTGRMMAPLVEAGHVVTGVDNSAEMLAIAQSRITSDRATFVQADMANLTLDSAEYALIIISYNTLMHLTQAQLASTLRLVRQYLRPDGQLLIDTENPFAMASMPDQPEFEAEESFIDPETKLDVTPAARWVRDDVAQRVQVDWRYARTDGVVDSAEIQYHYHLPHTIQTLLTATSLRWQTAYGDYDQAAFEEDSPRLILLCQ